MKRSLLCGAALLGLAVAGTGGPAAAQGSGNVQWFGTIYIKFLDGNEREQNGLQNASEGNSGDQGQGIEADLQLRANVSRQVEAGVRIQSRFNKNYWANFGGFGADEEDPLSNQYIKLRGAYVRLTPGYEWVDSIFVGTNDFGLWDPVTLGKIRYIDRDNAAGVIVQGTAGNAKWDFARMSLPKLYAGPRFSTGDFFAQDAAWVGQVKLAATPTFNLGVIALAVDDNERSATDRDTRDGRDDTDRYSNYVGALKGQFTGVQNLDVSAAVYYSELNVENAIIGCEASINGNCRFSPTLNRDADDWAAFVNFEVGEILPNFTFAAQLFHIGADYQSILAARREADVLLTEGREGFWAWERPDYNFGNPGNQNSIDGIGYGGWNGHMDQVVALAAENALTDFDERAAESVIGWRGATLVPRLTLGDLELRGEVSWIDYDTNWQACGGVDKDVACGKYPRFEGNRGWGLGGDNRSPFAPYQDKETWILALNGSYLADIGSGLQLAGRIKYMRDTDDRVNNAASLADAYNEAIDVFDPGAGFGNTPSGFLAANPTWLALPAAQRAVTSVNDDDRQADYWTLAGSAGYQLTQDLFGRFVYEYHFVDLVDGTVNVRPVGLGFEGSNAFGWAEYQTGEHSAHKFALQGSYFLSGLEVGADVQWIFGEYDPSFRAGTGQTIVRTAAGEVVTPLGNIPERAVDFEVYRMKVFMKVQF